MKHDDLTRKLAAVDRTLNDILGVAVAFKDTNLRLLSATHDPVAHCEAILQACSSINDGIHLCMILRQVQKRWHLTPRPLTGLIPSRHGKSFDISTSTHIWKQCSKLSRLFGNGRNSAGGCGGREVAIGLKAGSLGFGRCSDGVGIQ